MFDFTYIKHRLPERNAVCVIWHKNKIDGADCLVMNMQLATFDYSDRVWRFIATNEIVDEDKKGQVSKYIEIPRRYWNQYLNKGSFWNRIKLKLKGIEIKEDNGVFGI